MHGADGNHDDRLHGLKAGAQALGAAALLVLLLNLPEAVRAGGVALLPFVPVELLAAALAVALWPSREGSPGERRFLRSLTALLTAVLALKALDAGVRMVLGRPFVALFDLPLLLSGFDVVWRSLGPVPTAVLAALVPLGLAVTGAVIALCLRALRAGVRPGRRGRTPALLLGGALALGQAAPWTLEIERELPGGGLVSDAALRVLLAQGEAVLAAVGDWPTYRFDDGTARASPAALASGLRGADLLVVFLESYGRAAIEDPRYGTALRPALRALQETAERQSFGMVSGWLESPTFGGQSWLAHSTLLGGLSVDNQLRYKLLLSGTRRTLVGDLKAAGYRTVLVAPAIDRPWPEVAFYGFDRTYFAADLGYAGPRYDWVTMPDQYTLHAFERAERRRAAGAQPLFGLLVLISSHAPWTPVAEVVEDWPSIGDGRLFARWAGRGEPPALLWRDAEKVRRQYRLAMTYVIEALRSYLAQLGRGGRRTLVLLVGDHQPGPIVSGPDARRDVPVHAISNDPALLAPFRAWGLVDGAIPAADAPVRPMSGFRDWFLTRFAVVGEAIPSAAAR